MKTKARGIESLFLENRNVSDTDRLWFTITFSVTESIPESVMHFLDVKFWVW